MSEYGMWRYLELRKSGKLGEDTVWRNYDFSEAIATRPATYRREALKSLGLGYAGELGVWQFAQLYEVPEAEAEYVLASWWCWSRVGLGVPIKGAKIRAVGPQSAPALPT